MAPRRKDTAAQDQVTRGATSQDARAGGGFATHGGRVVGIDPGQNTGLVAIEVDSSLEVERGTFLGSAVVHPSQSRTLSPPERDADFVLRIRGALERWSPDLVVLEEPLDGSATWKGGKAMNTRDTAFRLGVYYMAAVAAAAPLGVPMMSYPVTHHRGRAGWMTGSVKGADKHDTIALRAKYWCTKLWHGPDYRTLSDHELMAFGVLGYHLDTLREVQKSERLAALRRERGLPMPDGSSGSPTGAVSRSKRRKASG